MRFLIIFFLFHLGVLVAQETTVTISPKAAELLNQASTSSLERIFYTDRDEEAAKADGARQTSILMPGCMCTYCPNQNGSLTQHPSDFPVSVIDRHEIFGIARIFHTDRDEEAAKGDGVRQASILMPGCMCPYCPNKNGSLTQHLSLLPGFRSR